MSYEKKIILFTLPDFRVGGAERVFLNLINNIDHDFFEVHVAVGKFQGEYCNKLIKEITLHELGSIKSMLSIISMIKLLKSFGVKILVNDKKKIDVENTNINKLIKNSDIISLNINLNSKKKILDKKKLKLCKKNCLIINTSRPEVIDYNFLYLMLKKKEILGAGLDVFMEEPYSGKLIDLENVILTPHIGSYSKEIRSKMEQEALRNILESKI